MSYYKNKFLALFSIFLFLCPLLVVAVTCDDTNLDSKTDQELQAINDQCEKDKAALSASLADTQKQSATLQTGIANLTNNINKTQLDIKAKSVKIKQLGDSVVVKTKYIVQLSDRMNNIKNSIGKMLRDTYSMDDSTVIDMLLSSDNLSNFFINNDNYATINQKLQALTEELTGVKKTSEQEKQALLNQQVAQEKLKFEQEQVKAQAENLKKEKQTILTVSKGQEALYQKAIADKIKLQTQIRNKLYRTAGGEEISFGDALKIIQPYESTIGVSSALVLAVLFQESAVDSTIGKNIGKCTYNQVSSCSGGNTVMSETQKPYYLEIMSNLGLNANTSPVSCPICRDGSYGGAMGPAQFMPLTWDAITQKVSNIIGGAYPSPFENLAAFTASALLLKDNQTRCKTAFSKRNDIWSCSAAKYYGGLGLAGTKLSNSMHYGYGASVLNRALQFEKDIATLNL